MTRNLTSDSRSGPFAELPFTEVFASYGEDEAALGIPVLARFAEELSERQPSSWGTTTVVPADTAWIATTIGAYDEPSDWTEISVNIRSWSSRRQPSQAQRLWRIWVSLEVACWCAPNHNIHRLHEVTFEAGSPEGLRRSGDATLAVVDGWTGDGLLPADMWRRRAGLPLRGRA